MQTCTHVIRGVMLCRHVICICYVMVYVGMQLEGARVNVSTFNWI